MPPYATLGGCFLRVHTRLHPAKKETVRFREIDNVEGVCLASGHVGDLEVEPLRVAPGIEVAAAINNNNKKKPKKSIVTEHSTGPTKSIKISKTSKYRRRCRSYVQGATRVACWRLPLSKRDSKTRAVGSDTCAYKYIN